MRGSATDNGSARIYHEALNKFAEHVVAIKTESIIVCFKTLNREFTKDVQ
jgi:hypothetical protein